MNEIQTKLLEQASSILSGISDTVSKAADFANEQLPEVAVSYVAYGRAIETTWVLFGIAVFIAEIIAVIVLVKKGMEKKDEGCYFAACMTAIIATPISLIAIGSNLSSFYMVWLAPKVWLIKEIVHLIK